MNAITFERVGEVQVSDDSDSRFAGLHRTIEEMVANGELPTEEGRWQAIRIRGASVRAAMSSVIKRYQSKVHGPGGETLRTKKSPVADDQLLVAWR
jgi:hypothetical protein